MNKTKNSKEVRGKDNRYADRSFNTYVYVRNGNFSTSASVIETLQPSEDTKYQVRNKVTEKVLYATKRK